MDRGIVTLNKHLTDRWDEKMQTEHRERIKYMPAAIDMKAPQKFKHLEYKPKKVQQLEGKFFEISIL